jgi:hypothetical protein
MNDIQSESSSRYKKWLILWSIFFILFSMMLLLNSIIQGNYFIYTILTQNFWVDMAIIFLSIPGMSLLAFIIGGYTLTPLLLYIHKKVLGRYLNYGIREMKRPKEFKRPFVSSIYPALLAFNVGILLSDQTSIHSFIFNESFQSTPLIIRQILTLVILLPLVSFIAVAAFSAVYFLLDSGIEYTNKNKKKVLQGTYPIEVRSVGGYYLYFLKGYTGLSVIIMIIQLIFKYITALQGTEILIFILNLMIWPIMPFIIALFIAPISTIRDFTFEKRNRFTQKRAKKLHITGQLEDPLGRK